ncbi:MAG TPA: 30S ribosomal protein S16 [Vicinamibacterales bacterium]|jgi:small subunit ribosomal protein S16
MLAIRLSRIGSKKQAHYRLVVCESKQATGSRVVEIVGHYNPRTVPATVNVEHDRIAHWLKMGARPSETVRTLLAGHVTNKPEAVAAAPAVSAQ